MREAFNFYRVDADGDDHILSLMLFYPFVPKS
jgi:hypothetical protein